MVPLLCDVRERIKNTASCIIYATRSATEQSLLEWKRKQRAADDEDIQQIEKTAAERAFVQYDTVCDSLQ